MKGYRAALLSAVLCLPFVVGAVVPSCVAVENHNTNSNTVKLFIGEDPIPPVGCVGVHLSATSTSANVVTIHFDSQETWTLLVDGADAGPASDGQEVRLEKGTHSLQLASGACRSNIVVAEVQ